MNDPHRDATTHTLSELLDLARENELGAAELYTQLSEMFSHIPDIAGFWNGMKNDELYHAAMLREIRKGLALEQLLMPPDQQMWEKVDTIRDLLHKDLLGPITNLNQAYELAHELEFSEVNVVFSFLMRRLVPSEEKCETALSNIVRHQDKLIHFSDTFGDRAWREQVQAAKPAVA